MVVVATGNGDKRNPISTQVAFTFTNYTELLSIDCNNASNDQLSDALATLILVLMQQGVIKGTVSTA